MDRIDLHIEVCSLPSEQLLNSPAGEATAAIRERCSAARDFANQRQGKSNQVLAGQELDTYVMLDSAALQFLQTAAKRLGWSARGTHRTLKVARTIADLAGSKVTQMVHVAEAMQYRPKSNI